MSRSITQRELRNNSGKIMKRLDRGEAFIVTRNGVPVAELRPVARRRFVTREEFVAAMAGAPALDLGRLRRDIDRVASQDPTPRA